MAGMYRHMRVKLTNLNACPHTIASRATALWLQQHPMLYPSYSSPHSASVLACYLQVFAWCAVFVLSVLIVASRKHYTVDVLIAWYVVPLVFYAMLRRWTTKRPVNEEPWPHRSLAEDDALQLEEIVVHGTMAAPEVRQATE